MSYAEWLRREAESAEAWGELGRAKMSRAAADHIERLEQREREFADQPSSLNVASFGFKVNGKDVEERLHELLNEAVEERLRELLDSPEKLAAAYARPEED